jgi:hypothetical protein
MKRLFVFISLGLFALTGLRAQALSASEIERASAYLKKTSDAFLASVKGLSPEQIAFKPAPERWSVGQVSEHIAAAEDMLFGMIQEQVMKAPARTQPADVKEIDELVLKVLPDRSHKLQAPEPLIPTNRFGSEKDTLAHFKESRAKTIAFVSEGKDLRGHAVDSPLGKQLDAYQWVLFIAAHSERHTKQIEEVKADPGFPKK